MTSQHVMASDFGNNIDKKKYINNGMITNMENCLHATTFKNIDYITND
jgi:hypothetical protein